MPDEQPTETIPQMPKQPIVAPPAPAQTMARPKTIYINFFDGINESKVKGFMALLSDIVARHRPETLYFLFASPGGSVDAGIVLYNFLRALPLEIVMHNTGSVDSIGTVIFLAGTKRYAAQHSTFLFHGVQTIFPANSQVSHGHLAERLNRLRQDENKIAGIVADRSKLSASEIRKLFHQGETKDIAFAIKKGIIHEARDVNIPKDAPFITVNLN
jgi:ATP-dependent protease ClpP protease subunit